MWIHCGPVNFIFKARFELYNSLLCFHLICCVPICVMFARLLLFCIGLLIFSQRVRSFMDECDSLAPGGLRISTTNLTVDTSQFEPQTDPHRYSRNIADDGFVKYASQRGFDALQLTGYVYSREDNRTSWRLIIRTGPDLNEDATRRLRIDSTSLNIYRENWPDSYQGITGWHKFAVNLTLEECPKVMRLSLLAPPMTSFYLGY